MHEFAIAKRFDLDGDGILNDKEKKEWLNALRNGYEQTLFWAEDSNDPSLNLRVVQKGGKILLPDTFEHNVTSQPVLDKPKSVHKNKNNLLQALNEKKQELEEKLNAHNAGRLRSQIISERK